MAGKFSDLSIKFRVIIGIVLILIIAMVTLSVVFIKQSESLLIKALEGKADLLNRNFSIVSAKSITEYSFTNLNSLINEAAARDREVKVLVVSNVSGMIIATSDQKNFPQFSQIKKQEIVDLLPQKKDMLSRDKENQLLESVRFIHAQPDEHAPQDASVGKQEPVGFIYIALDTTYLQQSIYRLWMYSLIITLGLMVLGVAVAYWFGSSMTKPIGVLAEEVRIIASGNLDKSIAPESDDEIGQLVTDVEKMRLSIKDLTENLEAKVEERTRQLQEANQKIKEAMSALWGEMELAKKIQTVLLPVKPELLGYDISASLEPADEVGGDYYDIISVDGYDWIIIGDVSGHGVPAGLVMMMAQTAIHTVLMENPEMPVSQLLSVVNMTISANIKRLGETKYMTMTVLAGVKNGVFSFAGLHQDILIYRAATGKLDAIETTGMWLGIEGDISQMVPADNLKLELGDCMVLYTDGVTEAINENGEMFGHDRLLKVIEKNGDKLAADIHHCIVDALDEYEKPDDVTVVVVKRMG